MRIDWEKYDKAKATEIAKRFGTAAVTEMLFNITRMSLVDKGNLLRSVKSSVRSTQGEVDRVSFTYIYYGRFLENGAKNVFGKGVTLNPKHWRSQAIQHQKPILDKEFSEYYASLILGEIVVESAKMEM
jgi:hypothetical protein